MKKIYILLFCIFAVMTCNLYGCSSDRQKTDAICRELQTVSLMTDDCHKMSDALAPLYKKYLTMVDRISPILDEEERAKYVDSVSVCLYSVMEIQTGACGSDPEVRKIFDSP